MNIKITAEQHSELSLIPYKEYLFGSRLHGINSNDSDYDYIRVIEDSFYDRFSTVAKFLPNIHSWQYDDKTNNSQYVWMTETQFYRNLFSGDGNMIADVVLLSGNFENPLFICRTYKIIKGYLGVAKRDLKLHGNNDKKRFHAYRSLYMARFLIHNSLPTVKDIKNLKSKVTPSTEKLFEMEKQYRKLLNSLLNEGVLELYPNFVEKDPLVKTMLIANNTKEFKYE